MPTPSQVPTGSLAPEIQKWVSEGLSKPAPLVLAFFLVVWTWMSVSNSKDYLKHVPFVNAPKSILESTSKIRDEFLRTPREILDRARALFPHKTYGVITELGPMVVLPSHLANEIRNSPQLDFESGVFLDFNGHVPGFEGIASALDGERIMTNVVRKALTQSLSKVTRPLVEEASHAIRTNLGVSNEWEAITIYPAILDILSRMSSRVFLNEAMCRDEDWIRVTKTYTVLGFQQANVLNLWPRKLRYLVHWFMPTVWQLKALLSEARALMRPVVEERRRRRVEAAARGEPIPRYDDCIDWFEAEANGRPYDPAVLQLNVSVAAMHTTSDLVNTVVQDLADRPDVVADLRAEIADVLRAEGWRKTALLNMKLLDSAIKESQRLKPGSLTFMRRRVEAPLKLSDGTELRAGDRTVVDAWPAMRDPALYENPDKYDPRRFLRWREQPGRESKAYLVSTSPEHLAFGHGEHACPGRFFAANETKILLSYLLLHYDFKRVPGTEKRICAEGFRLRHDPSVQLLFRRRTSRELDFDPV